MATYRASVAQWVPAGSHFDRQSPYHPLVHLDIGGHYQVDSTCERVSSMQHVSWFVLPPAQEFYFRKAHAGYRELPAYRADCERTRSTREERSPMEFLYPNVAGKIYIPIELNGSKGRTIFEAVHRDPHARISHAHGMLVLTLADDRIRAIQPLAPTVPFRQMKTRGASRDGHRTES